MTNATPEKVEAFKASRNFDEGLAELLIPVGHPRRNLFEDDIFRPMIVNSIRLGFDAIWCRFVSSGAKRIPAEIFGRPPVRVSKKFAPRAGVESYVKEFLLLYYRDSNQELSKKEARLAAARAMRLLREVVARSELANLLSY